MMKKRSMVWVGLFVLGYYVGADDLPRGLEFMLMFWVALISGIGMGIWFQKKCVQIRSWKIKAVQLAGYELKIQKRSPQEVTLKSISEDPVTDDKAACDFCLGEKEIRLAGTKEKIDCPKCKGKATA